MSEPLDIAGVMKRIREHGPARVVVDLHAQAESPRSARLHGIIPQVIFIRGDGWSLGAPLDFAMAAYNTWAGDWVYVLTRASTDTAETWHVQDWEHCTPSEWLERDDDA